MAEVELVVCTAEVIDLLTTKFLPEARPETLYVQRDARAQRAADGDGGALDTERGWGGPDAVRHAPRLPTTPGSPTRDKGSRGILGLLRFDASLWTPTRGMADRADRV